MYQKNLVKTPNCDIRMGMNCEIGMTDKFGALTNDLIMRSNRFFVLKKRQCQGSFTAVNEMDY